MILLMTDTVYRQIPDGTPVVDSFAPRTNQAFVGLLSLTAFAFNFPLLAALLAIQLALAAIFGRKACLACIFFYKVIQPRFGEGPLEDARPPRFANAVGAVFMSGATLSFALGAATAGWALVLIVSALALLAATTGLCLGCEIYVLLARLRGAHLVAQR